MDRRFNHLDPTSVARSGESVPDRDAHAMTMTHGYSQDHWPDLKPAVVALLVSPDGGLPVVSQRWEGHTAGLQRCQDRAPAVMSAFKHTPNPR
jgi:hypothetical protein